MSDTTGANTKTEKTAAQQAKVEEYANAFKGMEVKDINRSIKAAKTARWNAMSNWQKAGHVTVSAAPFVVTAAVAGTAGYALGGGFAAAEGEGVEGVDAPELALAGGM